MTDLVQDATKFAKDTFYVTVGLGVIAFQKAQVRRNEIQRDLRENLGEARGAFDDRVQTVEDRLEALEGRVDDVLDDIENRLPEQVRDVVHQARDAAKEARGQLREIVDRVN